MLMWISAAVLAIGIAVFLGIFLTRGNSQAAPITSISSPLGSSDGPAVNGTKPAPHVKPSGSALQLAHRFLVTAVARKNLASIYPFVGPMLTGGVTKKQWISGNNPVTYYPAKNLAHPDITVKTSTKNHLDLLVGLVSKKRSDVDKSVKSLGFDMSLDRIHGKWMVTYFLAHYSLPHLPNPANGGPSG
jgi:hypothetical protein